MRLLRLVGLAGFLAMMSCDNPFGGACTLIGCNNQLNIRLKGELPPEFTVHVDAVGISRSRVVECNIESPCEQGIHVSQAAPDSIAVTVRTGSDRQTQHYRVEYEADQPNGPDCEPTCLVGTFNFNWES